MATIQIEVPDELAAQWASLPVADRQRADWQIRAALSSVATAPAARGKSDDERATAISRTLALLRLTERWNGDGFSAPDPKAVEYLLSWLLALYDETFYHDAPRFIAPIVTATPKGDAVAEWWRGAKSLGIFVSPTGEVEYVKAWGIDIGSEMEDGDASAPAIRRSLYDWVVQEGQ